MSATQIEDRRAVYHATVTKRALATFRPMLWAIQSRSHAFCANWRQKYPRVAGQTKVKLVTFTHAKREFAYRSIRACVLASKYSVDLDNVLLILSACGTASTRD
ncbi:hypothetical protein [Deefgea salmonis]|uniref:Transposase n=1 Tax=Deefgea salmonis TaxID=2875502 RepID=A0ABS8BL84_9NEIS|nr:hypothetical protein [Deefgea salmonis]MCB5196475.1 hypothetical protein [Deefgea salmonis]